MRRHWRLCSMNAVKMLGTLLFIVWCAAFLATGCGSKASGPDKPATAGTAEQLANTTWSMSGGTVTFKPGSVVEFTPKGGAVGAAQPGGQPQMPAGNYTVADGIVRASIPGVMPFSGTWDGTKLVIMNEECKSTAGAGN